MEIKHMDNLKITLFWEDKNWRGRGYANNLWLRIYPEKKSYKTYNSYCCDTGSLEVVTVKRKSDIKDMIKYLNLHGYVEESD